MTNKHPLDEILEAQMSTIQKSAHEVLFHLRKASRDRTLSEQERRYAKEQLRKLGRIYNALQERTSFTDVVRRLEDQKATEQRRRERRKQRDERIMQRRRGKK